jgi:hypothetical protein
VQEYTDERKTEHAFLRRKSALVDETVMSTASTTKLITQNSNIKSYSQLGYVLYGYTGYYATSFTIIVHETMAVIGHFFFINEYFPSWIAAIAVLPINMFVDFKRLSYLAMFALMALFVNLVVIIIISYDDIRKHRLHEIEEADEEMNYFVISGLPLFYGISCLMYDGDYCSLNVEDSMKKPKDMPKVAALGVSFMFILFSLMGIIPYIAYKGEVDEIIYESFSDSTAKTFLKISYTFAIF